MVAILHPAPLAWSADTLSRGAEQTNSLRRLSDQASCMYDDDEHYTQADMREVEEQLVIETNGWKQNADMLSLMTWFAAGTPPVPGLDSLQTQDCAGAAQWAAQRAPLWATS